MRNTSQFRSIVSLSGRGVPRTQSRGYADQTPVRSSETGRENPLHRSGSEPVSPLSPAEHGRHQFLASAEQRQDVLARRIRDRERLDAQLLLNLQRLQTCRLRTHVGVDQRGDASIDGAHQVGHEILLNIDAFFGGAQTRRRRGHFRQCRVHGLDIIFDVRIGGIGDVDLGGCHGRIRRIEIGDHNRAGGIDRSAFDGSSIRIGNR